MCASSIVIWFLIIVGLINKPIKNPFIVSAHSLAYKQLSGNINNLFIFHTDMFSVYIPTKHIYSLAYKQLIYKQFIFPKRLFMPGYMCWYVYGKQLVLYVYARLCQAMYMSGYVVCMPCRIMHVYTLAFPCVCFVGMYMENRQ